MASSPDSAPLGPDLAQPISFAARYGEGAERTIVLGGGGLYFVAWQTAYLSGLIKRGIRLDRADIVVGTSAGSIVASILTAGKLRRFEFKIELLARVPALLAALAPAADLHPSQQRAVDLFRLATDADPATIRQIGHAALAAQAGPAHNLRRSVATVTGIRGWGSPALQITAVDTYTGERLVITDRHAVSVPHAAAASASVPGLFEPQPILDRRCMDGGVSGSGTHCDRVAGAQRALVVSLVGGTATHEAGMTTSADAAATELDQLRASGTDVHAVGPASFSLTDLMNPAAVPEALERGDEQAGQDAEAIAAFWVT